MRRAVARMTCTASSAVSGCEMRPLANACRPYDSSSPNTPATVGVDSEGVPPSVAAVTAGL